MKFGMCDDNASVEHTLLKLKSSPGQCPVSGNRPDDTLYINGAGPATADQIMAMS